MSEWTPSTHESAMRGPVAVPTAPVTPDPVWATVVSAGCLLRGLPLFFRKAPRTPLRVLGIIAFDTLHVLRHGRPLPPERIHAVALFLDFCGCTNAALDGKHRCDTDLRALRQRLDQAGLAARVDAHVTRLRALEAARPAIGGDRRRFAEMRAYREAVARLTLATAAAIAGEGATGGSKDPPLRADDEDVELLFRILMQCQIIDDVLDYAEDRVAGLPSFLTVPASRPLAAALTAEAMRDYARGSASRPGPFPLRVALAAVSGLTGLVVHLGVRT